MILMLALACAARAPSSPSASPVPSPSITVRSQEEVWTRGEDSMKSDREIPVSWPVVEGPDPALNAKLAQILSPEAIFEESRTDIEADGWADTISYTLDWQGSGLLGLTITMEGSAAYPDVAVRRLALDLEQGALLDERCFAEDRRATLVASLDQTLQANIEAARATLTPEDDVGPLLEGHAAAARDLHDFGLRPQGVLFVHEFGFPHVALALEPDGNLLMSWAEIDPFLSADCPLKRATASASP